MTRHCVSVLLVAIILSCVTGCSDAPCMDPAIKEAQNALVPTIHVGRSIASNRRSHPALVVAPYWGYEDRGFETELGLGNLIVKANGMPGTEGQEPWQWRHVTDVSIRTESHEDAQRTLNWLSDRLGPYHEECNRWYPGPSRLFVWADDCDGGVAFLVPYQSWEYREGKETMHRHASLAFVAEKLSRYRHYEIPCDGIGPELFDDYGPPRK